MIGKAKILALVLIFSLFGGLTMAQVVTTLTTSVTSATVPVNVLPVGAKDLLHQGTRRRSQPGAVFRIQRNHSYGYSDCLGGTGNQCGVALLRCASGLSGHGN